jgi:hypothetical protein
MSGVKGLREVMALVRDAEIVASIGVGRGRFSSVEEATEAEMVAAHEARVAAYEWVRTHAPTLLERIAEADATIASLREAHMEMTRLCLKANDERKAAEERIAALEADSARLDWLAQQFGDVELWSAINKGCPVDADDPAALRAAIDAALALQGAK